MSVSFPIFAEDLRYHPSVWHRDTGVSHPAMIAAMRDVQGVVQAVHRTYLTPDGRKLSGEGIEAKKMLGSSHGCAIRLAPVSDKVALRRARRCGHCWRCGSIWWSSA